MKIKYKLLDQKMQSYNATQWIIGEWKKATGTITQPLCSNAWLHCYDSPLLAILHNPIHRNINNPRLFEVEVKGKTLNDNGTKRGYRQMKLVKEIPLPIITQEQRIRYAILCACKVYKKTSFLRWANNWMSNKERTSYAANAAAHAANAAAATNATAHAAAHAANAAYAAANATAHAAYATALAAAYAANFFSLVKIAEEAIQGD